MAGATTSVNAIGAEALRLKGRLRAHKWLLLRRASQLGILALFLLGPWFGIWIIKGNLASSLLLETVPMTDPYLFVQTLFAGHVLEISGIIGALLVLGFYLLVGGRAYCAWVCPLNLVTDSAAWLNRRLGLKGGAQFSRTSRYWLLGLSLLLALLSGTLAWELVNPVTIFQRSLIFGLGLAGWLALAIFLFDVFIARRGWCGHLCPVGAFYSLPGRLSLLRVSAARRGQCDDCMDCFAVCPEPQVIRPALKGQAQNLGPVIMAGNCTNCGRCIDVCARDVFQFATRFQNTTTTQTAYQREALQ